MKRLANKFLETKRNKLLRDLEITELLANPFRLGNQDFGLKKSGGSEENIRISLFPKLEKIGKQIFRNERNQLLIHLEMKELLTNPFRLGNQDESSFRMTRRFL